MKNSERFSGSIGEEYNLFRRAVPHHEKFQDEVGKQLRLFCEQLTKSKVNVVEAGIGTGITTIRILGADPRIFVTAIDNEAKMIRQAKARFSDSEDRIDFIATDLLTAIKKIPRDSVDAFVSAYTLHNFLPSYRKELFGEISRILGRPGLFLNADKYASDDPATHAKDLKEQFTALRVLGKMGRPDLEKEWNAHYLEDEKNKITEGEQVSALKELGFKNIKITFRKGLEAVIRAELG
jgi:tRNA (cmo5U34)-methyltransferase